MRINPRNVERFTQAQFHFNRIKSFFGNFQDELDYIFSSPQFCPVPGVTTSKVVEGRVSKVAYETVAISFTLQLTMPEEGDAVGTVICTLDEPEIGPHKRILGTFQVNYQGRTDIESAPGVKGVEIGNHAVAIALEFLSKAFGSPVAQPSDPVGPA